MTELTQKIIESFMLYYATDWIAMVLTFFCFYLLGKKKKSGFIFGMGGNVFWFLFGWQVGSVANLIANTAFFGINLKGYMNWSKKEK